MKLETGNRKLGVTVLGLTLLTCVTGAAEFTGPDAWRPVNTNAVKAWDEAHRELKSASLQAWPGVVADAQKREVRLLAEAVGHRVGITTEFLLVGPLSDRAYEAAAVTVAKPSDIVRAVERLGIARGGGVGSRPFRFWPCGERFTATVRRLDVSGAAERPLQTLVLDADPAAPLLGEGGLVFAGGRWEGADAQRACLTDTQMPSSVIALYNEPGTLFDVPFQVGQSEVYGRLTLAEALPYGALLEVVLRPFMPKDGAARVLPLTVLAAMAGTEVEVTCKGADGAVLKRAGMAEALTWLRAQTEAGREPFVTVGMDDAMPLKRAADVARVFGMLDGKGIKLDGKTEQGLFPRAFLPQEKWRERKDRNPQPFELHVEKRADGTVAKKLIFIEEDWNVQGLDPKLTPCDYPFENWDEFPKLVEKTGGADSKVGLLFVFAPADLPLSQFMPGVRAVSERLPLVYVFGE
jgi:hypothetical protein